MIAEGRLVEDLSPNDFGFDAMVISLIDVYFLLLKVAGVSYVVH